MNSQNIYDAWAPASSIWSVWTKPVAFVDLVFNPSDAEVLSSPMPPAWVPPIAERTAVILDLPGAAGVLLGFALAKMGYQCVPLYNSVAGPVTTPASSVLDVAPVRQALAKLAPFMARLATSNDAPPVFLLDSRRLVGSGSANPGKFDNRWVVFPQDFPSATFLMSNGIQTALVVTPGEATILNDLNHVLRQWQDSGLRIKLATASGETAAVHHIAKPSRFRSLIYRALVLMGFRRHGAGGFGALIPDQAQGGGYG